MRFCLVFLCVLIVVMIGMWSDDNLVVVLQEACGIRLKGIAVMSGEVGC